MANMASPSAESAQSCEVVRDVADAEAAKRELATTPGSPKASGRDNGFVDALEAEQDTLISMHTSRTQMPFL